MGQMKKKSAATETAGAGNYITVYADSNFKGNTERFEVERTAGRFGVHLVREISPWSSQVLCIGLAQNLKPILSDDKYWNINPNISAFGM